MALSETSSNLDLGAQELSRFINSLPPSQGQTEEAERQDARGRGTQQDLVPHAK